MKALSFTFHSNCVPFPLRFRRRADDIFIRYTYGKGKDWPRIGITYDGDDRKEFARLCTRWAEAMARSQWED